MDEHGRAAITAQEVRSHDDPFAFAKMTRQAKAFPAIRKWRQKWKAAGGIRLVTTLCDDGRIVEDWVVSGATKTLVVSNTAGVRTSTDRRLLFNPDSLPGEDYCNDMARIAAYLRWCERQSPSRSA